MKPQLIALVASVLLTGCDGYDAFSNPRGERSITVLDVTPGGKYLGAINGRGEVKLWDLETKQGVRVRQLAGVGTSDPLVTPLSGFGFRGDTGEILYECALSRVCSVDVATGVEKELFDHGDAQDRIHLYACSADGRRLAVGTLAGRVLTFDAGTGRLAMRKPRDRWTPGRPLAIYALEGPQHLGYFLSATEQTTMANEYLAESNAVVHHEGFVDLGTFQDVLWRGPVVWQFDGGDPNVGILGVGGVVRANFGPREDRVAVCDEGGPRLVFDYPSLDGRVDLSLVSRAGSGEEGHQIVSNCGGIRFLDPEGDWIGVVAGGEAEMELCRRSAQRTWSCTDAFRLRHKTGSGARPLIALPEKKQFFVGLASGGVDWYELDTEGEGRARFLRHLSWED